MDLDVQSDDQGKTDLADSGNDENQCVGCDHYAGEVIEGNGLVDKPLDTVLENGVDSCNVVHDANRRENEYMDKDLFPDGVQQNFFLKEFAREKNKYLQTFDLKLIGNFPSRKICFGSLPTSLDSLEIQVIKQVEYSDELSTQLSSKYKLLGFTEEDISTLRHEENIHIIIAVKHDSKEEIIGHLCCRFVVDNKFFVVVLMAMFEYESITRRNRYGSMLLVLAEEVKNIMHSDKGQDCSFYISFKSNRDDQKIFEKFLQSCYFEKDLSPANTLQDNLQAPVKMNYYYRTVFPVILTTALFLWRIPQESNNFPYCCKQVLCYLLQGWEMRRKKLNRTLSNTSTILKEVFPDKTVQNHSLPSTMDPPEIGERVSDAILQSLVERVKTTISQTSNEYVPGLFVSDLGYRRCEAENPSLIGTDDNENNEAHCLFMNAANALFSDVKEYTTVRKLFCLIFHILSRLPEDHPFLGEHFSKEENIFTDCYLKYNWFFCFCSETIPLRVLQHSLLDNEEFDERVEDHEGTPFDKGSYDKLQKNLTEENGLLFDYHISDPKDLLKIYSEGTVLQKKKMYREIARCYLCDDFQGDTYDLLLLGKMFAVAFRTYNVTDASNGDVEIKENKSKGKGKGKSKSSAKKKKYDFEIDESTFGWNVNDTADLLLFDEDNGLYYNRHMTYMFCFAVTGTTDGHYLYFSDTNFDEKSNSLVPLQNLKELAESDQKPLINKFLEFSHDYQQPIVIDEGDIESVIHEDGQFVLKKPIMFTAKGFDKTGIQIKKPLSRNAPILKNFRAIMSGTDKKKNPEVITGHNMERVKIYSWKQLYDLFKQTAPQRNSTSYNQIDYCIMHSSLSDSVVTPTFVRDNDWIDRYFSGDDCNKPKVQKVVITSTRHSFMNFHIDFGGAAFWYHLLNGQKEFILIECTDKNLRLYESFVDARKEKKDDLIFFADTVSNLCPETIYRITLRAGQTLVVPVGYIHSVYTPLDSIAVIGSFFYDSGASQTLTIHDEIECFDKESNVLPFYREMVCFALVDFYDRYDGTNIASKHLCSMIESSSKWYEQTTGEVKISSAIVKKCKKKLDKLATSKGFEDFPAFLSAFCLKQESLKQCNISFLEINENSSKRPTVDQTNSSPVDKRLKVEPAAEPTNPQKNETKEQTISSPAKNDQQKDAPKDQDQMSTPPAKEDQQWKPKDPAKDQTKSPSAERDQQKVTPKDPLKYQTNSSPEEKMTQKNQTNPPPDEKDQHQFFSSNWAALASNNTIKTSAKYKRKERTKKRGVETQNLLQEGVPLFFEKNAEGMIVNCKKLLAKKEAFSVYFDLIAYKKNVDKCRNSNRFEKTLKGIYKKVKDAMPPPIGKCWAIDNGRDNIQKCAISMSTKWNIDVGFDDWAVNPESNVKLPLVRWMKIKEDILKEDEKTKQSVFANRKFVKDEVIGLFWGDRLGDGEIPSEFAFANNHGTYDPKGGFHDNMAVHIMNVSFDENKFNARLTDDFLVRAVHDIGVNQEIILTYDNETVWKPKKESIKSTNSSNTKSSKKLK